MPEPTPEAIDAFIAKWSNSGGHERGSGQYPSKYPAAVTRKVARALADLAKSLEKDGHDPQVTAGFLQRCHFTMFAEDVELLPKDSFKKLLEAYGWGI